MSSFKNLLLVAALSAVTASAFANASLRVTEVHSAGSGNGTYAADWFELTNISNSTLDLTGFRIDDNSQSPAGSVPLRGVASLAPGQSAVFMETAGSDDTAKGNAFKAAWFGPNVPLGFLLGFYNGSGIGLSTTTDQVNIYNGNTNSATLLASVRFDAATANRTFDNSVLLLDSVDSPLAALSSVGVNGAFLSFNGAEIGSPGAIPEPSTYALIAGLGALGVAAMRRLRVRAA